MYVIRQPYVHYVCYSHYMYVCVTTFQSDTHSTVLLVSSAYKVIRVSVSLPGSGILLSVTCYNIFLCKTYELLYIYIYIHQAQLLPYECTQRVYDSDYRICVYTTVY